MGVLRWQRIARSSARSLLKRPITRLHPEVRVALRMGCFEVHKLGVPAPVATDAMIRLTRRMRKASAAACGTRSCAGRLQARIFDQARI